MTTFTVFINVISSSKFEKVVAKSNRSAEQFCLDAAAYYKRNGIETIVKQSEEDKCFFGVFSCRNSKLMAVAGPEQNEFFWRKHTLVKKNVNEANGGFVRPKRQKKNFYAVISAEYTGFVLLWSKCKELTQGKSTKYKGFNGLEEAKVWMRENNAPSNTFEHITDLKQIK